MDRNLEGTFFYIIVKLLSFFKLILFVYFSSSCDELLFVLSRFCIHYSLSSPLFSCQLITFANSLDPVQNHQNVCSDLDTDHWHCDSVPIRFF